MSKTIVYRGVECEVVKDRYLSNARTALVLKDSSNGSIVTVATINLPNEDLNENEVIIKDYSENEGLYEVLLENGIVEYAGRFVSTGFVICPVCVLKI